jgi:hypothetical protein
VGLEPLDGTARHDLLEILEERYGRRSTIITSQIPVDKWHELIGDPTYADAILDRIVHNAHRVNLPSSRRLPSCARGAPTPMKAAACCSAGAAAPKETRGIDWRDLDQN